MRIAQIVLSAAVVASILTFGFGSVFVLLALFAAFYLLIVIIMPILVRSKVRMRERPDVVALSHDDASIPDVVRTAMMAQREDLIALGFEPHGCIHQPAGSVQSAYLALFRHPETQARALSRIIIAPTKGPPTVQSTDVELEMRYDNGTTVELSNVAGAAHGLDAIPGIARQMPHERDTPRLFEYFLKLAAKYEGETGISSRSRVPLPDSATLTDVYYEQLEKSFAIQHRIGLLAPTTVAGVWRPTWRYALLIAGGLISPGPEFVRRRLASRGERLRRDLDGDATRSLSERIGRPTGWILLMLGLALIPAATLMSLVGASMAFLGMMAAWWLVKRRGREPDWRALLAGGAAAAVLFAVPMAVLEYGLPFGVGGLPLSALLNPMLLYVVPIALLTIAAAIVVEGFRAVAT